MTNCQQKQIHRYDAWFLNVTPKVWIVPVPCRHILTLMKEAKLFGLSADEMKSEYEKRNEIPGSESSTRDHYMLKVMERGVIRVRYYRKSALWRLQIFDQLSDKQKEVICNFVHALETRQISNLFDFGKSNPNFEIYNTYSSRIFFGDTTSLKKFLSK